MLGFAGAISSSARPVRAGAVLALAFLVLIFLVLLLPGCARRGHSVAIVSPDSFRLDFETPYEDDVERYDWVTVKTEARLEFRVRRFDCGSCRVSIFDGAGDMILDHRFGRRHDYWLIDDDEYLAVAFTQSDAVAGRWTILLDFDDFCGHLYLILD
ncbi:MAG: hypothetical protein JXP34_10675 [Planctomycetes bacterium]|nr:hypothetical protein [Planctomycetota bacterium]